MSIVVTIAGTDVTERIQANSLKIENVLTQKRDLCSFTILSHSGNPITPVVGQEVVVTYDPGTGSGRVFGGVITELNQTALAFGLMQWKVDCQDYTRLLDRKLIPDRYEDETVDDIIADWAARYFPVGFTTNGVDADVVIKAVSFNYKPISKCLDDLAKATGYDWYVDSYKDLHFFQSQNNPAPFDVEDDNGTYEYDSLIIRRDNSQVRNTIIVRGGEYLGAQFTSDIQTNGVDFIFPLGYRYADFAASLTGEKLNVGIDYIDNPDHFDALYNFQEKILRFRESRRPSNGSTLLVSGKPYLPVIVRQSSPAAIATMSAAEGDNGVYEYLILDKTITSKEAARQRARAEMATYASTLSEGEFRTESHGLRAGMKIRVNSVSRGIDENFIINKVVFTQFGDSDFHYQISLITTRSFDLVDLLIRLSLSQNEQITISDTEVAEILVSLSETGTLADSLGTFTAIQTPYLWDQDNLGAKHLVISQLYSGGGSAADASYDSDFIEIYNPTSSPISLASYSVQYTPLAVVSWSKTNLSGTIPAYGYFLIKESGGGLGGAPLPTPDVTGTIPMATSAALIVLRSNQTTLSNSQTCDGVKKDPTIVDFVAYGSTPTCYEGSGPTGTNLTKTTAAIRKRGGNQDTDNNAGDFEVGTPIPRNSSSPICQGDSIGTAMRWRRFTWT